MSIGQWTVDNSRGSVVVFVWIILTPLVSTCRSGTDRSLLMGHNAYSYDRWLGIFYTHYHIDMITHRTAFGKPIIGAGGDKSMPCWNSSALLKQTDHVGLKHWWPAWQTETLTIMLLANPRGCRFPLTKTFCYLKTPPDCSHIIHNCFALILSKNQYGMVKSYLFNRISTGCCFTGLQA